MITKSAIGVEPPTTSRTSLKQAFLEGLLGFRCVKDRLTVVATV